MDLNAFFKLVSDVGFPIAGSCAMGYFIFLTIKFILAGVMSAVNSMKGIIMALDNRVKTMNHDVIRIDTLVSNVMGVKPDIDRIARADGKNDARRD
jgi:archaellum biogenesis ATPase FlaH